MKILIAYDVSNDKRRKKIQKLVYQFSDSYQKSAVEVDIDKNQMKYLAQTLDYFSDDEDLIAFIHYKDVLKLGKNQKVEFVV